MASEDNGDEFGRGVFVFAVCCLGLVSVCVRAPGMHWTPNGFRRPPEGSLCTLIEGSLCTLVYPSSCDPKSG